MPKSSDADQPADEGRSAAEDAWAQAGLPAARPPAKHKEPYRTLAVLAVAVGLMMVPAISLLGHRRLAVMWLLALLRLQRPEGTWIAARGRVFDVVFGILLAAALFALTYYAGLPRVA